MPATTRLMDLPVTPTGEKAESPAAVEAAPSCSWERTGVPKTSRHAPVWRL